MSAKFYGKYRGAVTNNFDPRELGRIRAHVPDVFGTSESGWALPCVLPGATKKIGGALPKIGAAVWIEFEQGNPDFPIWSGCFFGRGTVTPPSLRNSR